MGGFGASGSTSKNKQSSAPPDTSFLNPMGGVLANMFGIDVGQYQGGLSYTGQRLGEQGFRPGGDAANYWPMVNQGLAPDMRTAESAGKVVFKNGQWGTLGPVEGQFANQIFGPDSFSNIADLGNYENLGGQGAEGVMGGWADYLSDTVQPTMEEGLSTGFRTNMDPIIAEAQRVYRDETMPQIAQQYAGQTGSFSTDFLGAGARAGGAMGSQLGALQAQMDEAASDRRAGLLPMAGLPADLASLGLGVGDQYALSATPGGQQATLMQMLTGQQPTSAISRGNISEGKGSSFGWGLSGSYGGKGCWVAAVYFGYFTPEWRNARRWIQYGWNTPEGVEFRNSYNKYGPIMAEKLRSNRTLREKIRPLFEWFENQGSRMLEV